MGKTGKIDFIVSKVVNQTECLADVHFPDQNHEPVILRVDTTGYVEGQEIKSDKPFKVTGYKNYTIFLEGSVGFANSFVLEELPVKYHGEAETFTVDWRPHKANDSEEPAKWVAEGTTAMAITGDIKLAPDKITIMSHDYPLTLVRDVESGQFADVARLMAVRPTSARLYKIKIPKRTKLVNGNNMCGTVDSNWMLAVYSRDVYSKGRELSLAFFSGEDEPNLDYKVISTSTALCGTFGYGEK